MTTFIHCAVCHTLHAVEIQCPECVEAVEEALTAALVGEARQQHFDTPGVDDVSGAKPTSGKLISAMPIKKGK